jgi:hypothetical protein
MVWVIDSPNSWLQNFGSNHRFAATARSRLVNWAGFICSELHGIPRKKSDLWLAGKNWLKWPATAKQLRPMAVAMFGSLILVVA